MSTYHQRILAARIAGKTKEAIAKKNLALRGMRLAVRAIPLLREGKAVQS